MQIQQAYLDAQDGLVRSSDWLYFHGNHFRWNLIDPRSNPTNGENFNRFTRRLSGRIPDLTVTTQKLSGHFHLGIHPHFHCVIIIVASGMLVLSNCRMPTL